MQSSKKPCEVWQGKKRCGKPVTHKMLTLGNPHVESLREVLVCAEHAQMMGKLVPVG